MNIIVDIPSTLVCNQNLTKRDVSRLQYSINNNYQFHMELGMLHLPLLYPLATSPTLHPSHLCYDHRALANITPDGLSFSAPVGFWIQTDESFVVFTHRKYIVTYNNDKVPSFSLLLLSSHPTSSLCSGIIRRHTKQLYRLLELS